MGKESYVIVDRGGCGDLRSFCSLEEALDAAKKDFFIYLEKLPASEEWGTGGIQEFYTLHKLPENIPMPFEEWQKEFAKKPQNTSSQTILARFDAYIAEREFFEGEGLVELQHFTRTEKLEYFIEYFKRELSFQKEDNSLNEEE